MSEFSAAVDAVLNNDQAPTPPLADYLAAERIDSNISWRLGHGHTSNLLDQAVEALEKIRDECGQVCENFTECKHRACNASQYAWAIAEEAVGQRPFPE